MIMKKTSTDIKRIRERVSEDLMIRLDPKATPTADGGRMHIMVCGGTGCGLLAVDGRKDGVRDRRLPELRLQVGTDRRAFSGEE